MEVIAERCAGLDVHKRSVVACVRVATGRRVERETRRFTTFAGDLVAMRDWLTGKGVTVAFMESTGVYWQPVCRPTRSTRPHRRPHPSNQLTTPNNQTECRGCAPTSLRAPQNQRNSNIFTPEPASNNHDARVSPYNAG